MFPGCRILFARQTKHSLAQTILQTFEDDVLPKGVITNPEGSRAHRQSYDYKNGSMIVLTGLDDLTKLLSGEYDMIIVFQAEECDEQTVMGLVTRLSGNKLIDTDGESFVQLGMDCNPRGEGHWIKQGINSGKFHCLDFRFQDNPRWFNPDTQVWTKQGIQYVENLENSLTGIQKERMLHGRWVNPEGSRFKHASRSVHGFTMKERFPYGIPEHWARWMSGDWGRAAPFCCLWHTVDPQTNEYYTYLEAYTDGLDAQEQAELIVLMSPANDLRYDVMYMDGSMWSNQESFGAKRYGDGKEPTPAATVYRSVFDAANMELGTVKFPSLRKGARNTDEEGYVTLETLFHNKKWLIELGCVNLWREVEDAVFYIDPRTGYKYELINPSGIKPKPCSDHALMCGVYAFHKRSPLGSEPEPDIEVQIERENQLRMEILRDNADKRHREKTSRYRT